MKEFRTALIADDSGTSRMIVRRCVEMAGVGVGAFVEAENGLDALARLRADRSIDLVLTDLNMPKMDGRSFVRMVRSDPAFADVALVIVSSIADGDAEAEFRALGVSAVVKKPVSPAKLLEALGGIA